MGILSLDTSLTSLHSTSLSDPESASPGATLGERGNFATYSSVFQPILCIPGSCVFFPNVMLCPQDLQLESTFTAELPGDPNTKNRRRQVTHLRTKGYRLAC